MNREERIYSVTMTEDELRLFSEFLEQKEFNSKAQKARRRKFDLEQGLGSNLTDSFKPTVLTAGSGTKRQQGAISQAELLGKPKTAELLDKSTKNTITVRDNRFLNSSGRITAANNRSELKEMENAQNLLRAGRQRSRDVKTEVFEKKKNPRESFNRYINSKNPSQKDSFSHIFGPIKFKGWRDSEDLLRMDESRKVLRDLYESRTNPILRDGKVKKLRKLAKAKKVGKAAALVAIPTAVAIGTGTAIYKKNKKNKDNKGKDKEED